MSKGPTVKFLLVDDTEENLLALEGLLRRDGLEMIRASSGPEALELLLKDDFGLAILDVQMPGMDGYELAEIMRSSPRTMHIPIIFLTAGQFDRGRRFRGYEAGAVDFLFKPIEPAVLKSKADVFYHLYKQRLELEHQLSENARLVRELKVLNESLEERVRERTGQLMEANDQLQGFTYSMAHDFRQHIRNINTNAQIMLAEADSQLGVWRHNLERIRDVAMLMNQMSEDLLAHARARTVNIQMVDIDLTAVAKNIAENYKIPFPRTEFEVEEGMSICADRTLFRILIENLIDNAFKYSQKVETPKVEVCKEDGGFAVRDNGMGINMDYASKLFKPFERLSPNDGIAGTGMGLANVKRIVDRHKGKIWISPGDPGVTFHVCLDGED